MSSLRSLRYLMFCLLWCWQSLRQQKRWSGSIAEASSLCRLCYWLFLNSQRCQRSGRLPNQDHFATKASQYTYKLGNWWIPQALRQRSSSPRYPRNSLPEMEENSSILLSSNHPTMPMKSVVKLHSTAFTSPRAQSIHFARFYEHWYFEHINCLSIADHRPKPDDTVHNYTYRGSIVASFHLE